MAVRAQLGAVMRYGEPGVIESGTRPARGRMARVTCCREPCGDVVRVVGALVVRLVTAVASG